MPSKRGKKRKRAQNAAGERRNGNEVASPLPPQRESWLGWVEMESEPAFFNVMLKEMGIDGVKVQEVFCLDDIELGFPARPIHALIFLFKYKAKHDEGVGTSCPDHVWFANQIPDFACGTVALLNIVNNIPGLKLGNELQEFRSFTSEMDPMLRGHALDGFDFVRKIHNSFARPNDMLNADMALHDQVARSKRQKAAAKARQTREAKTAIRLPLQEQSTNPASKRRKVSKNQTRQSARKSIADAESGSTSPLSDLNLSDKDHVKPTNATAHSALRRSTRKRQTRIDIQPDDADDVDDGGFHFISYVPIQGHVWKLDGLDHFPEDIGTFDEQGGGDWMKVIGPALRTRMALHEAGGFEFNLMAVVRDPLVTSRAELSANIRALQLLSEKLNFTEEDWRTLDGVATESAIISSCSAEFGISAADVASTDISEFMKSQIESKNLPAELILLRQRLVREQPSLLSAVRDAQLASKRDQEEAWHRRHDYGAFVKGWLEALAENELLTGLLAESDTM